jgi:hypothetical protein
VGENSSGTLQAGRNPEEPRHDLCSACSPDWLDPFEDRVIAAAKRASYKAHLNKAVTAALTVQGKAEKILENVAKARRMLANPILSSGTRAQLVIHRAKG